MSGPRDGPATVSGYDDDSMHEDQLFFVRMWYEPSDALPGEWRGSVSQVGRDSRWYFADFAELVDFIRLRLAAQEGKGRSW